MTPRIDTPWGPVQSRHSITPDLTLVTTASHGGIHVSSRAWDRIRTAIPAFVPFAGAPWLEEDCDFHVAVLLWPAAFDHLTRWHSWRFACSGKPGGTDTAAVLANWMATTPAGADFYRGVEAWTRAHADTWMQGSGGSSVHNRGWWRSDWTNISTGAHRSIETPRSPNAQVATTAELDAFDRALPRQQLGLFTPAVWNARSPALLGGMR